MVTNELFKYTVINRLPLGFLKIFIKKCNTLNIFEAFLLIFFIQFTLSLITLI